MKVLMGTKNPGKIEGTKQAFEKYFEDVEIIGVPVESNVSNQPTNEEIYQIYYQIIMVLKGQKVN